MSVATSHPATAWSTARLDGRSAAAELLFGRMHEDAAIELDVFQPGARVLCIASAGCTAIELGSRGFDVTAVDINPAQIGYVRARIRGAPVREGAVDGLMRRSRALLPWLGWSRKRINAFLASDELDIQKRLWSSLSKSYRWRLSLRLLLRPSRLKRSYSADFVAVLPQRFDRNIAYRLARAFEHHPNHTNPFVWRLLADMEMPGSIDVRRPDMHIRLTCADAAEFLEGQAPCSFDAFSLSNILDGATPEYAGCLSNAVRHAAAPGATLVLRSLREPRTRAEADWAGRDRAMIWGAIYAGLVEAWHGEFNDRDTEGAVLP